MVTDISFRQFDAHCEDATRKAGWKCVVNACCTKLAKVCSHCENDPSDLDGNGIGVEMGRAPPISRVEDAGAMGTHQNAKDCCPYGLTDVYLPEKGRIVTSSWAVICARCKLRRYLLFREKREHAKLLWKYR